MDRTLKTAKRKNKRRQNRNGSAWRRFSPGRDDLPLLQARPHHAPDKLRPTPLLPARHGSGEARPLGHALPPHPAPGRLRAGAADDRLQPRRARHRLLHRLRGEHRDSPGPLLPAQRGRRRGGRGADRPQGHGNRRLTRRKTQERRGDHANGTDAVLHLPPTATSGSPQVEESDRDIHTGETYHCGSCGIQVIFQAVTAEDYVPPPRARRDCHFCNPEPCRFGPSTDTTNDTEKGETT